MTRVSKLHVVALVFFVLSISTACTETRSAEPSPLLVAPSSVEAGSEQWITIEGEGFEPVIHLEGREGAMLVDTGHRVRIGDEWSERVVWSADDRLVAQLPQGLFPGLKDVAVVSPSGREGSLKNALCAGERESRRILFLRNTPGGIPTLCEAEETSLPGLEPREIMSNALLDLHRATAVSQNTGVVVSLRWEFVAAGSYEAQVVALYPWEEGHEDDPPIVLRAAPLPDFDEQVFSMPVLTRDAGSLVYTESEGARLLAQRVPRPSEEPEDPVVLFEEPEGSPFAVHFPEIDPTGRRVVFSRIQYVMPECDESAAGADGIEPTARAALWQVPLEGGEASPLLDEEGVSNGPAAFLPGGDRIVFMSDRLGMLFPIGQQCVASVVNLYTMDLGDGTILPATAPTAMSPFGPPQVSADGRWVAMAGYLADTLRNSLDVLLVDLEDGAVYRAADSEEGLCSAARPQACQSLFLMPTFTPDAKALIATGVPMVEGVGSFLLEVTLPEDPVDLPSYDRTLPSSHVRFFGRDVLSARAKDFYAGCEDR